MAPNRSSIPRNPVDRIEPTVDRIESAVDRIESAVDRLEPLEADGSRLLGTSSERAATIAQLSDWNPDMADLLMDLEADDELRTRLEMDLLNR